MRLLLFFPYYIKPRKLKKSNLVREKPKLAKRTTRGHSSVTTKTPNIGQKNTATLWAPANNYTNPFSSLLDSFQKSSFSSKGHSKSSNDTIKISTLSDKEGDSHKHKISRFEGHPFLDLHKNGYFE